MQTNRFYVYLHCNEMKVPFYVGKGQKERAYNTRYRGKMWKDYINKHPFIQENVIFYYVTSEELAFALEKELIFILRKMCGLWLANATDGGEGMSGYNLPKTEKHRKNISLSQKGKPRNFESIEKMTATRRAQCAVMTADEKLKRNKIISDSLKLSWETISPEKYEARGNKISLKLLSRSAKEKAISGAKGWETRRQNVKILKETKI